MYRSYILVALVFAFLICSASETYACTQAPIAEIVSDANDVCVGEIVNFDGSDSYDPDGGDIQAYEWLFPIEAYYLSGESTAYPRCKFSPVGTYTVKLKVKDDEDVWSDYDEYEITILAAGPDWYVAKGGDDDNDGQSWQTALATIQAGIDSAVEYDRVWVNEGTYYEQVHLKGKDITVQCIDPNDWEVVEETIIDPNTSCRTTVSFAGSEGRDCVFRGFTITGGDLFPENGLEAYWKLDESSGGSAQDATGNGHTGTLEGGPTWDDDGGRYGGALEFDGESDYIALANVIDPGAGPFSAFAWVKSEDDASIQVVLQQEDGDGDAHGMVWLYKTADNKLASYLGEVDTITGPVFTQGQWHHVGLTYDGTTLKLYVNSEVKASNTLSAESEDAGFRIGAYKDDLYYWNGLIDEVRIYERVLSAEEIFLLGDAPRGYWRLDKTCDGTDPNNVVDSSGNGNDGTLQNDPNQLPYNGYLDGALQFDGSEDDYVWLPNIVNPADSSFSAFAWVKSEDDASIQVILQQEDGDGDAHGMVWLYKTADNKLASYLGEVDTITDPVFAQGQWHHVGLTYDGTTLKLYVNSEVKASNTLSAESEDAGMRIGAYEDDNLYYWNGLIDEVRIYDYVLNTEAVEFLYQLTYGGGICGRGTQASIHMCRVTENTAHQGAGMIGCDGEIRNCIVAKNEAEDIGGGFAGCGDLYNCTVVYNTAEESGGIVDCNSVNSCIVWGNEPNQIDDDIIPVYSHIEGWSSGDPVFTNAALGDYHLEPNSPCIDTGDPNLPYEREPYGGGGRINMGAYGNTDEATMKDSDKDGMPDYWEEQYDLDPYDPDDADDDDDNDDLTNLQEYWNETDPTDDDTDMDGMDDGWEVLYGLNPLDDTDDNKDADGDSLTNEQEYNLGTDPTDTDSDNDGMDDGWEYQYGLNPLSDDSQGDKDNDGMHNLWEYTYGLNPDYDDTGDDLDEDGMTNGQEYEFGSNPNNDDSDDDGMPDGWEYQEEFDPMDPNDANLDLDEDEITNVQEYEYGTDPNALNDGPISVITMEYDTAGQVIRERIQKIGEIDLAVAEYDFDRLGRAWRTRRWADSNEASNSNDIITLQTYDVQSNVLKAVQKGTNSSDPDAIDETKDHITSNTYDSLGRIISVVDAEGGDTQYSYYPGGKIEEFAQELVEGEGLIATQINFYYTANRLTKVVNGEGHYRTSEYNSLDQVICEKAYDCGDDFEDEADDASLMQTRMEYNGSGRLARRAVMADPNVAATDEIDEAVDQVTDFDYYGAGETAPGKLQKQVTYYDGTNKTQAVTYFGYDDYGRQVRTADAAGNQVFTTYNDTGRVSRRQTIENNGLGEPNNVLTVDFVYDTLGRMIERRDIIDPDEPETYLKTEYEYDSRGLMTKKTLPKGTYTTFSYNAWGLKSEQVADAGGIAQKTEYGYDRLGRQTTITGYADGSTAQTTAYDLDKLGRVETITYPDTKTIQYEYYPQGTVKQRTDQRNLVTNYQYDHVGNLVKKTVTFDSADYEETFAYDGLGRMVEAVKYRGATHIATSEFVYNAFSKVTEATETILNASAVEIGYEYDQLGRLTGITYPDGDEVTIDREPLGRIDTIKLEGDSLASYKYIGPKVKRRSYTSPGVNYDISYNGLGRATRHYAYTSGGTIADFGYTFDDNGNITAISYDHRSGDPENDFTYDDLDRLTRVDYLDDQNDNEQFTYDDLGNRTEVNLRDGTTDTYARNELTNRYDDDQGEDIVCDYDNAGNLTQDPNEYEYEYDYENRLIKITKNSGATTVAEFEYDALNRRIEKDDKIAGEITRYYHNNNWQVLAEYDDNGDMQRWFIYGNFIDEPLAMIDDSEDQYYYVHNHLFSTVAVIDENGDVIERYEYNAYGMPMIYNAAFSQTYESSQYDNPYLFTSRRVDSFDSDDLKLQYNRNRYYDYYTGQWLSQDPLGITPNPQNPNRFVVHDQYRDGMNLYEYVTSRPITVLDLYGLIVPPIPTTNYRYPDNPHMPDCGCFLIQADIDNDAGHALINCKSARWGFTHAGAAGPGNPKDPSDKKIRGRGLNYTSWALKIRNSGTLKFVKRNGKVIPCKCATCDEIIQCITKFTIHTNKERKAGRLEYDFYRYNCRDWAKEAISKCCLTKGTPFKHGFD